MEILKKYLNDKYIFLKLYAIVSIFYILTTLLNDYINENVLLDTLRYSLSNVLFGSLIKVDSFMIVSFEGVPFAILLVFHFGFLFARTLKEKIGDKDIKKSIIILIVTIIVYMLLRLVCKSNLPFSIYEAMLFGSFVYLYYNIVKIYIK